MIRFGASVEECGTGAVDSNAIFAIFWFETYAFFMPDSVAFRHGNPFCHDKGCQRR
ncbi:hypothetical protein HDF11_001704 [Tunturiibacter psychrotolerans]